MKRAKHKSTHPHNDKVSALVSIPLSSSPLLHSPTLLFISFFARPPPPFHLALAEGMLSIKLGAGCELAFAELSPWRTAEHGNPGPSCHRLCTAGCVGILQPPAGRLQSQLDIHVCIFVLCTCMNSYGVSSAPVQISLINRRGKIIHSSFLDAAAVGIENKPLFMHVTAPGSAPDRNPHAFTHKQETAGEETFGSF